MSRKGLLFVLVLLCPLFLWAEEVDSLSRSVVVLGDSLIQKSADLSGDSVVVPLVDSLLTERVKVRNLHRREGNDTLQTQLEQADKRFEENLAVDTIINDVFVPDPNKTLWYALAFPGLGQIYNRSYWKLPIVYACVAGATFAITRFSVRYNNYLRGYQAVLANDPTKSYLDLLPEGYSESMAQSYLKGQVDTYRRYRDYAIVAGVAVYALQFLEAYVDALLREFDVSPDLSMKVRPSIQQNNFNNTPAVGGSLEFRF